MHPETHDRARRHRGDHAGVAPRLAGIRIGDVHFDDRAAERSQRIVILHQGRILADGTLAELQQRCGEQSLEHIFNQLTGTRNLLARAEEFARALTQ